MKPPQYLDLGPVDFIKWIAARRGVHARDLKACASRWLANSDVKRSALCSLSNEINRDKPTEKTVMPP